MKQDWQGTGQILIAIRRAIRQSIRRLVRGISGADQRDKQRLMRQLAALQAEYNVLNRELLAVRDQLGVDNQAWQTRYDQIQAERDDLQLEIWELEDLIEELFELLTTVRAIQSAPVAEEARVAQSVGAASRLDVRTTIPVDQGRPELDGIDLSGMKLALVGGHDATRRGAISDLRQRYGLTRWVELPPFCKHSIGRSNIKAKLQDCDLIVLITGYMKHQQTDSIMQLKKLGTLSGDVVLLTCRGKSGVVREILNYIRRKDCKL
ncbi:MAG: hypothetical protein ACTS2F_17595 [Thainema sp.]